MDFPACTLTPEGIVAIAIIAAIDHESDRSQFLAMMFSLPFGYLT